MNDANLFDLALIDQKAGRLDRARNQYRRLICRQPENSKALYLLGIVCIQSERVAQASAAFHKTTVLGPTVAEFHFALGEALRSANRYEHAARAFETAIGCDPKNPESHNALGLMLRAKDDIPGALARFETGLEVTPDHIGLIYNRAMTLHLGGNLTEAVDGYEAALAVDAAFLDARNNRARALQQLGRSYEAIREFRRALVMEPGYAIGLNNLGVGCREAARMDDAAAFFRRTLVIDSDHVEALNNLGLTLWALDDEQGAMAAYERALNLRPDLVDVALNLASAQAAQGRTDAAASTYDHAARHHPADGRILSRRVFNLPQVYDSRAEIDSYRERIDAFLVSEQASRMAFKDPIVGAGVTNFFLAYHGYDDRPIAERIAEFYRTACPRLSWTAPGCEPGGQRVGKGRLRVGICSKYLNRHTIGLLFEGLITRLAQRDDLELVILRIPGRGDEIAERIDAAADQVIRLPGSLVGAQEAIAAARLDILLYTDIGLEPESYFLAFARLAPVQLVTWGHPVTTGLKSLDGYLSADVFEPDQGEAHYTEGLIRTRNIMMRYRPPVFPDNVPKTEFGLSDHETAYVCPQNIFKLHPDFDAVLAGVLRADPKGRVVLIASPMEGWNVRLRARLQREVPDILSRIVFLPHLPTHQYFRLLAAADVILDPIHFGGGFTTFHSLSFGKPLITLRGEFQRSRFASGAYRLIGVEDLVALDIEGYIRLAVDLGGDKASRVTMSKRIKEAARAIQDTPSAGDELYELLVRRFAG